MPSPHTIPTLFGRATAVLSEHANLNATLARIRSLCSSESASDAAAALERTRLIDELTESLHAHFAAEEDSGYFGTIVAAFPHLGTEVARLRAEHREFLLTVQHLQALSQASSDLYEFAMGFDDFAERLAAHEHAEHLLLQEFLMHEENDSAH